MTDRPNRAAVDEVAVLWAEHLGLTYPDDLKGLDVNEKPVVLLDAYLAGCISSYLAGQRGELDTWRLEVAADCADDLRQLLPRLRGPEGRSYVARLIRAADLILDNHTVTRPRPGGENR